MYQVPDKHDLSVAFTALLVWFVLVSSASAQPLVGGGFLWSWQPDNSPYVGTSNPSVPAQGIHGSAAGVFGTVGAMATPHLGLAVELSLPSRFTADQVAAKYRTHNTHRDVIVSGVLHVRPSERWVDGVIGVSYVREQTDQQSALRVLSSPGVVYEPFASLPESIERDTFGVVGGFDFPLPLGRHVSITPHVRVHWIARENDSTAASPRFLGLSAIVVRPACGLRVVF
jgi:hypothetical protein